MSTGMKEPSRGFDDAEYRTRFELVQRRMLEQQLSAILLTTEHDIHYYTGFFTQFWQSPTRPWFVVLPAVGAGPIAVIPQIGVSCMKNGWVSDIRYWSSPHENDDGVSLLADTLREVASPGVAGIGINRGRETHVRMPLMDLERLQRQVGMQDGFCDATGLIRQQRMLKSAAEIAKIRHVAQVVSSVFERVYEFVEIGMSDTEIFRAFKIECLQAGVDDVAYLVGAAGQGGYDDIISPPAGRAVADQDVLILDTGCVFDGYYCDFDRNFGFGAVSKAARRAHCVVWEATEAGLAVARPGQTCADLFAAMNQVLTKGGALGDSVGRFGHGLGLQLTEPPSHTAWDETELVAGMVLTLEPGMLFAPNKMMVQEENIVITTNGPELLSRRAQEQLPILA
jgi:Xaa-Pro aminopeptidase